MTGQYPGPLKQPGYPGPYGQPYGAPPPKPNRTIWWVAGGAAVLVLTLLVVAVVVVTRSLSDDGARDAGPSGSPTAPGTALDCGMPGENATAPITDRVVAGPLSFPISAAPGWVPQGYVTYAQSSQAQGLVQAIPGQSWQAHAEIGLTTFTTKPTSAEAARRMLPCIAAGAGYARSNPRLDGLTEPEAVVVDGVTAARVTARILVQKDGLDIRGDTVTVVVIDSAPQAYFMSDTPIGDEARAAVAQQIFDQLKVARDV